LSLTRTFSVVSLKIVFAFVGSALTFSGTATGTLAGSTAGPAAHSAASHPARSGHAATIGAARISGPFSLAHTPVRSRPSAVELATTTAIRDLTPRQTARRLLRYRFHWRRWEFTYLNRLWASESGWNKFASNPYSGAYGIPQAVPGSKMASAGPHWRSSARTQILWGMRYIRARYRTPYWAWVHSAQCGWY
jgi:hypothetical protein